MRGFCELVAEAMDEHKKSGSAVSRGLLGMAAIKVM
jgi:hypothetical protein